MPYSLHFRCFKVFEYADGSPPTVDVIDGASMSEGLFKNAIPEFKTMTKEELIKWIDSVKDFKSFTDTDIINSNGKISACHIKVVDAWIKEYPDVVLPPDYKPWEEGKTFGTR
jgi:hypothetical protein